MRLKRTARYLALLTVFYLAPSISMSDDIKKADKYYQAMDYKYALDIYQNLMKEQPSAELAGKIASCYRFINDTELAEVWYRKVIEYKDVRAENYKYLADALKQNGKFDEAAANYKIWGEKSGADTAEAEAKANACKVAKVWSDNPGSGNRVENAAAFNSENSDFSPAFIAGEFIFASDRWFLKAAPKDKKGKGVYGWTGNPFLKLYKLDKEGNSVTLMDPEINNGYHNGSAIANANGDTLLFSRSDLPQKKTKIGKVSIYQVVKNGNKWVGAAKLPFNAEGKFSVQHPALSPDGKILYFASDMPGGLGGMDIYYSLKKTDGSWSEPKNCGPSINTKDDDVFPYVRKDGRFYFSSKGHVGMGGLDLFYAEGEKDTFSAAENLRSPLNSPKDDFGIVFNEDNTTGYLSSNRKGGMGMDDIYKFTLAEPSAVKNEVVLAVNGIVIDKENGLPMPDIEMTLFNKNTGKEVKAHSGQDGKFTFELEKENDYSIKGNLDKFYTGQEGNISTKGIKASTRYDIRLELERAKDVYTIKLNNIYYDFDKWNIRKDAVGDLEKVNKFMASMPGINMEVVAHTDSRGKASYNLDLSLKRAESAKDYLVKTGVDKNRLLAVGRGEYELINRCADGVKCTGEEHQANRRTEFKIIKVKPVLATR